MSAARHEPVAVHGHRGARARFPENTLPAFIHAIEAGADYIELDVLATADDVLVACHDPILRRRKFRGPGGLGVVREMTFEQLRQWDAGSRRSRLFRRQTAMPGTPIPALEEVLALAPRGEFGFNVEVKSIPAKPDLTPAPERYAELLVRAICGHGLQHRVIIQSFDYRVLEAVRRLDPALALAGLCAYRTRDFVAVARASGARIVSPYHRTVTRARVEAAHAEGIQVIPWTANRPRDWRRLISAGVDGIITDAPACLIEYLGTGSARDGSLRSPLGRIY